MVKIKEAIVVEGKYDKNTLSQVVDTVIVETSGFGIFSDADKVELLRRLAVSCGIIVLTDSDSAGFLIRNRIRGSVGGIVKHAYIPDVEGREKRKRKESAEGKLGVEGINPDVLLDALHRAGATFECGVELCRKKTVSTVDLYELGLCGERESSLKRKKLLKYMGLPEHMSTKALLEVINTLYGCEQFYELCKKTNFF